MVKVNQSASIADESRGEGIMPRMKAVENPTARREPPALTVDGRFDQLVALAVDLAEERLRDKSASNQLVSEIIRYGSQKEKLMREKIQRETEMLKAKADALKAHETSIKMIEEAMKAMAEYTGTRDDVGDYEDDEEDDDEEY